LFTIYNLNNSYFTKENSSKFQKKHVQQYSEGIVVFQFENFHILETFFILFFSLTI